ncbi:MAG: flagellar basal body-associated FliL family protein [Candidatus Brocadiaceae bacterium]|nr:flagellar basal body-associated FliL family protein [Candidatus Brocadiaceae bacterium]
MIGTGNNDRNVMQLIADKNRNSGIYSILVFIISLFVLVADANSSLIGTKLENGIVRELENECIEELSDIQSQNIDRRRMASEPEGTVEESLIVPFDPVIVNLSNSNARRYLKATINFEVKDLNSKSAVVKKGVQIKDRLISILSSRSLEDIEGVEGQQLLRNIIKDTVNVVLKMEDAVLQVYFTEFVVQ